MTAHFLYLGGRSSRLHLATPGEPLWYVRAPYAGFEVSTRASEGSDIFGGCHTAESGRGPANDAFPGKAGFPFGFFENGVFGGPL